MRQGNAGDRWRGLVVECFRREAGADAPLPKDRDDLIETGAIDSMGWVSFLRNLESASGVSDLGAALSQRTPTFESIFYAMRGAGSSPEEDFGTEERHARALKTAVVIACSSTAVGSWRIPSEEIDRAYGMPEGKLRKRAGIVSLAYAAEDETELTLGAGAGQEALTSAECSAQELDWILASSETHIGLPSLAARLHSQLLARETCGAMDIGGGCLGLLNAFAVAQSFIMSGGAHTVLVVTAEVHSRILRPGHVAGEFGGLFGDGASAFLLRAAGGRESAESYRLGEFFFGCAGQYAAAICVEPAANKTAEVRFDGEGLSRAALTRLEKALRDAALRSSVPLAAAHGYATHQPNPRLMSSLAKQLGVANERFPPVAEENGNLGSSTCGVALDRLLKRVSEQPSNKSAPIFLASLGPGLLFGAGWVSRG
ncbi:MAG TPA: 3-oxoacyl-[acyl-carrier-protein] synthase III C-terminal domain-containing protein [Candidatus Acidoferrum sp.]|nr:3-oxoacyl-[acyl-carrier-protein] synthase III C-terminal domain-containing protein [Candidatus Acidoferrum sp.]